MSTGGCTRVPKPYAPNLRFDQRPYRQTASRISVFQRTVARRCPGHLDLSLMPQLAGSIIAPQDQQRVHASTFLTYFPVLRKPHHLTRLELLACSIIHRASRVTKRVEGSHRHSGYMNRILCR